MKEFLKSKTNSILLVVILLVGFSFRVYGINWDQNQHLHPDERFLTMVTNDVSLPNGLSEYLDPAVSTLNPYNHKNYQFFVYGTLPLTLVKAASEFISFENYPYNNITLVGRLISALFDTGTIFVVYLIGKSISNKKLGLIASFIYATMVLPIQLSHFYAVDTFLVFFMTLTLFIFLELLIKKYTKILSVFAGLGFGLALASKISAMTLLEPALIVYSYLILRKGEYRKVFISFALFCLSTLMTFRAADPHVFSSGVFSLSLNPQFITNIQSLESFSDPDSFFPPAIQWITTKPFIYPFINMILWGLGIPLGLLATAGVLYSISRQSRLLILIFKHKLKVFKKIPIKQISHLIITLWVVSIFIYQGGQFVKALRYFIAIYPFLALITAQFVYALFSKYKKQYLVIALLLLLTWPLSFVSIYRKPHSRIQASNWIYNNIPQGSVLSCEHWDDCLPLSFENKSSINYKIQTLHLFDIDTPEKWDTINKQLLKTDYIILSSNRLWGTIPKVPEKYPITADFYKRLLSEQKIISGNRFIKVAEFTSYPTIPIVDIEINDDSADETFTVYDHPKVIIFQRSNIL